MSDTLSSQAIDPAVRDGFVESIDDPVLRASVSEPQVTMAVDAIVARLDPDMAQAFASGNPAIIQAVRNGAYTTDMLVNELIRNGSDGQSNLPPGIVEMVNKRQQEIKDTREDSYNPVTALAAALAGFTFAGMAEAKPLYYEDSISAEERASWSKLSAEQWSDQFLKMNEHDLGRALAMAAEKEKQIDKANAPNVDEMTKLLSDNKDNAKLMASLNKDAPDPTFTPEELAAWQRYKELGKPMNEAGAANANIYQYKTLAEQYEAETDPAKKAQLKSQLDAAAQNVAKTTISATKELENAPNAAARNEANMKADANIDAAADTSPSGVGALAAARIDNTAAGRNAHKTELTQEKLAIQKDSGGMDDEPAAPVAQAGANPSINVTPLAKAGQLLPLGEEAPKPAVAAAPAPPPRPTQPTQAMG